MNVIIGLSITKILNKARQIEYKTDCIIVILKGRFLGSLNMEKVNNPLSIYLIMSIIRSSKEKSLPYFYNFIESIITLKIKRRYINP